MFIFWTHEQPEILDEEKMSAAAAELQKYKVKSVKAINIVSW